MNIRQSGIILYVDQYETALDFYDNQLGLPLRHRGDDLAMFDLGGSYLIVEHNSTRHDQKYSQRFNKAVLRVDVTDFVQTVQDLTAKGIGVHVHRFDWGTVGVISDPEGNRIELKAVFVPN